MTKLIAVRSLLCEDHAHNIPPTVLSVIWNTTKRCNYDCSYCNSFAHDAVSPFVAIDKVAGFLDVCEAQCGTSKKIKWMLTGGEPFMDPNILPLLKMLRDRPFTEQVHIVSNGTMPVPLYQQSQEFLDGLAISLHFERSDAEISKTIDTIVALNNNTTCYTSATVMFLPGNTDRVLAAIERLKANNVSYVVQKITPIDQEYSSIKPYDEVGSGRKTIMLKSENEQQRNKEKWSLLNFKNAFDNMEKYYSAEESALIEKLTTGPIWQNAGVWYEDGSYHEINTMQLISTHQNSFKNWTCYAGVDGVYIDWDGTIYRGMCTVGGKIGNINTGKDFTLTEPVRCQINQCFCSVDIAVRKCADHTFTSLIT